MEHRAQIGRVRPVKALWPGEAVSGRAELTPFGESGGAVELEI